jgi:ABC-type branched-subunit amino acid transport system permease subunit
MRACGGKTVLRPAALSSTWVAKCILCSARAFFALAARHGHVPDAPDRHPGVYAHPICPTSWCPNYRSCPALVRIDWFPSPPLMILPVPGALGSCSWFAFRSRHAFLSIITQALTFALMRLLPQQLRSRNNGLTDLGTSCLNAGQTRGPPCSLSAVALGLSYLIAQWALEGRQGADRSRRREPHPLHRLPRES